MIKITARNSSGEIFKINFDGTFDNFEDLIKYDEGNFFVTDNDGWRILVKEITAFKQTTEEGTN